MGGSDHLDRFAQALTGLAPSDRLALAVSGGPDSLALLLLAHAARPDTVIAATVDHGLRLEARAEAMMVAEVCRTLGVPHAILTVEVADDPAGLQAAARAARYAALARWAAGEGAAMLATAHHQDDQAETVLMRLVRGAGIAGLSGIRRRRPLDGAPGVELVRPLLDWTKAELEALVAEAGLTPARDPSNLDPRFDRTRARALLAQGWPAAARLAAVADRLAEAEEALAWTAAHLAAARITQGEAFVSIDPLALPREHRRRLLLAGIARLAPDRPPRGDALDRLLDTLDGGRVGTLVGLRCDPGPPWRLTQAPFHR
ncbi:tRNA lysidine(34) synthetase TilS [Sphingomonas nostoxanthinifaciens]|uniref:tRNA lysidine(34) synthetase TilS n=1 Tax=Sphingomonas nostoxanthinifaciens TaxID=2872652 RepID=UPI001CC1CC69|nr:tRNA lysidine(34) synthetase TilS [Sphingomonas nostoxanthinifaciens]UAK24909.1 tRNA lysidine(34) synthetase TilS [Sphingomonas nostoxanthinifaciens]